MTAYAGNNLYVGWIYSGGTVSLGDDYRKIDYTPSVDLYDQTAILQCPSKFLCHFPYNQFTGSGCAMFDRHVHPPTQFGLSGSSSSGRVKAL